MTLCRTGAAWITALVLSSAAAAQPSPTEITDLSTIPDLEEGSGWIRVELAILVDDRPETLASEFWPPFPEVYYPGSHRWLFDDNQLANLADSFPMATVTQGDVGQITVAVPDPGNVIAEANEQAAAAATDDVEAPSEDANADAAAVATPQTPAPIPLELIDVEAEATRASVEWLGDFEDGDEPADGSQSAATAGALPDPTIIGPEPQYLPIPFKKRRLDVLSEGLRELVRQTANRLELGTAWLQPPDARNLPIILDQSGDSDAWPRLQGFVELRRGRDLRLGVNLWWNTDASYYPETFSMNAAPRGPRQITLIDPAKGYALTQNEAVQRQEELIRLEEQRRRGEPLVSFVDPGTGFYADDRGPLKELRTGTLNDDSFDWPWRHFVHIADTRPVPEGSVRYFDHPVVKVIASYRELTWGELLEVGGEDQQALTFEQAVNEAGTKGKPDRLPGGMVPPAAEPRR